MCNEKETHIYQHSFSFEPSVKRSLHAQQTHTSVFTCFFSSFALGATVVRNKKNRHLYTKIPILSNLRYTIITCTPNSLSLTHMYVLVSSSSSLPLSLSPFLFSCILPTDYAPKNERFLRSDNDTNVSRIWTV